MYCTKCGKENSRPREARAKWERWQALAIVGSVILLLVLGKSFISWASVSIGESSSVAHNASVENTRKHPVEPSFHSMTQEFAIGYWKYICNGITWSPVIGRRALEDRANASFLIVDITAENADQSASTLPPLHLMDSDGREYDQSAAGMMSDGFFSSLQKLNPGVAKRGYVAFDVPPNREYTLIVSGGFRSTERARVKLAPPDGPQVKSSEPSTPLNAEELEALQQQRRYDAALIAAAEGIIEAESFDRRAEIYCRFTVDEMTRLSAPRESTEEAYSKWFKFSPATAEESTQREQALHALRERIAAFNKNVHDCVWMITMGAQKMPEIEKLQEQAAAARKDLIEIEPQDGAPLNEQ
jgi:hypothetical protein